MKNKTWKNYLGAAALVTVLFAGSVSAYFTDQDEKVNTFTVGKVTIELEDPKWEKKPDDYGNKIPDEAERMTPNQTIIKDPQVKNTGNNDAFIYMTVEVPCRQIISVNNDGTRNPLAMRELYNYQVDNSWKLLGTVDVSDESGKKVAVKHLYAYAGAQGICTVVKPQETTKPLFNQVTFINAMGSTAQKIAPLLREGTLVANAGKGLEENTYKINIQAYGIQTTDLNGGTKDAAEIWNIITNQRELTERFS